MLIAEDEYRAKKGWLHKVNVFIPFGRYDESLSQSTFRGSVSRRY
jgi:hypothetical protein